MSLDSSASLPGAVRISVALVTRNRPDSLRRCLGSWRAQTKSPSEIVVSDDSDSVTAADTAAIAQEFGCRYTQGPRRGLYANRNHASLACGGTHILSADDDHTHPADYLSQIEQLAIEDPQRIWILGERLPGDTSSPLVCPAELHKSGFGCAPADPSRCAAIADGSTLYPRGVFDLGLRYDETYPFGGMWYLWGKLLASRGWHISFSTRTFVWHHYMGDGVETRHEDRRQLRDQLLATTYVQFASALWLDRSFVQLGWALAYVLRRTIFSDSMVNFRVRTRLPIGGVARAAWHAVKARGMYA